MNINKAVIKAARNGKLRIVKMMVEQGADVSHADNAALRNAAASGHLDIIKYLQANGVNIYVAGEAALLAAIQYGQLEIVKYLTGPYFFTYTNKMEMSVAEAEFKGYTDIVDHMRVVLHQSDDWHRAMREDDDDSK